MITRWQQKVQRHAGKKSLDLCYTYTSSRNYNRFRREDRSSTCWIQVTIADSWLDYHNKNANKVAHGSVSLAGRWDPILPTTMLKAAATCNAEYWRLFVWTSALQAANRWLSELSAISDVIWPDICVCILIVCNPLMNKTSRNKTRTSQTLPSATTLIPYVKC